MKRILTNCMTVSCVTYKFFFRSADSWDDVAARRRSRSSVRVNAGAGASVTGRAQRPAVGRVHRQTDVPSELCELVFQTVDEAV